LRAFLNPLEGIGLQIAKDLAARGLTVLVGSRDLERGERAAKSVGANAHAIQLDVTNQASIAAAAERIRKEFGRLDALVNNAAISHAGKPGRSLEEIMKSIRPSVASLDEARAVFETNVFGVIAVTQPRAIWKYIRYAVEQWRLLLRARFEFRRKFLWYRWVKRYDRDVATDKACDAIDKKLAEVFKEETNND
jgi:NAD(P)-dependent dehydrogenase (short-subunit alcohol dehydrogenase family)